MQTRQLCANDCCDVRHAAVHSGKGSCILWTFRWTRWRHCWLTDDVSSVTTQLPVS